MNVEDVRELLGEYPHESKRARLALVDYALMRKRSLARLARDYSEMDRPPTRRLKTLERWSSLFDWQHRVSRLDQVEEDERVERWVRRREELNEYDWDDGEKLRKQARLAISQLVEKPSLFVIASVLQAASKLQRLATGASTENVNLVGQSLISAIEHELARLGYDQVAGGVSLPEGPADTPEDATI